MSKVTNKPAAASIAAPVVDDATKTETPASDASTETPASDADKKSDAPAPKPTAQELLNKWLDADDAADAVKVKLRAGEATPQEFMDAKLAAFKAQNEYKKVLTDEQAEAAKVAAQAKMMEARAHICDVLGITPERLDELTKPAEDGKPNVFVTSFHTVFGNKPVQAKQGESGKSLANNAAKSGTGISEQIKQEILAGATYAELLAKYPTKDDATKLNGTARTVISVNKFKKQADGTYAIGA